MLMTDFNNSKPLTDWHVLPTDTRSQAHSMRDYSGKGPTAGLNTPTFVEGQSLVKPGLASINRPAKPFSGMLGHTVTSTGASAAGSSQQAVQQRQQPQQQGQQQRWPLQQQQQQVTSQQQQLLQQQHRQQQVQQQHGVAVGVASVQADTPATGISSPTGSKKPRLLGLHPESMVALLKKALQRNMRMAAPGHTPSEEHQPADSSSDAGSDSSSDAGSDSSGAGGITTITMEQAQLWCIACEEPAYLLSPLGFCGKAVFSLGLDMAWLLLLQGQQSTIMPCRGSSWHLFRTFTHSVG